MKKTKDKEFSDYIKKNFSSVSRRYDLLNHLLSFGMDKGWRKIASKMITHINNGVILDLCTGTCDLAISCLQDSDSDRVIFGVDFNHDMLLAGMIKFEPSNNLYLIRSDVLKLPFNDDIAEAILIGFGLRNLADLKLGLKEMFRVLKDNGSLVILEFSKTRTPIFNQIYNLYFRYALPFIGKLISGNGNFYKYLHDSVRNFPDKSDLINMISEIGFTLTEIKELTLGTVSVYHFKKFDSLTIHSCEVISKNNSKNDKNFPSVTKNGKF